MLNGANKWPLRPDMSGRKGKSGHPKLELKL